MRYSWLLLLALGCDDGSDGSDTDVTEDTGTEDSGDSDSAEPSCDFPSEDLGGGGGATLSGVIRDHAGNPLEDAELGLCKAVCRSLCTDASGNFSYGGIQADTFSFHVRPPHGSEDELVEVVWPMTFAGTESATQDVDLPAKPSMLAIPGTATELELATGLHVTVGEGDLSILFEPDPTEIGAVAIDTPFFPLPSGTWVGGWFLEPYDAKADAGLPVRFANSFGLGTGAQVRVWASSYDDFTWLDMGTFTESGGFLVADDGTAGRIPVLATLVIMDES